MLTVDTCLRKLSENNLEKYLDKNTLFFTEVSQTKRPQKWRESYFLIKILFVFFCEDQTVTVKGDS